MPCLCQRDDCGKIQVSLQCQSADSKTKNKHFLSAWNSCWAYIRLFLSSPFLPGCIEWSHFTHPSPQGLQCGLSLHGVPARVCTTVPLHAAVLPELGECCPFTQHSCQGLESLLHHRHRIPAQIHVGSHLSTEFWSLVGVLQSFQG